MEHRRSLKRKRGQETERRNRPGQDTHMNPPDDVNRGLSYRPLSRPTMDRSTRDNVSARAVPEHPRNRGNFERAQRLSDVRSPALQLSSMNRFPLQPFTSYPAPNPQYPLTSRTVESYSDVGGYPPLPPGAYVNPAFFNGSNEAHVPTSTNLPQDIQTQMDILNNLRRYTNR